MTQPTKHELITIAKIAERAIVLYERNGAPFGPLSNRAKRLAFEWIAGEVLAVHRMIIPLRLDELLAADAGNFMHDIAGIHEHIVISEDLETASFKRCFMPRYATIRH